MKDINKILVKRLQKLKTPFSPVWVRGKEQDKIQHRIGKIYDDKLDGIIE